MRKRLLLAGIVLFALAILTAGVLAYLNDTDSSTDSVTLSEGLSIQLLEPHWDASNSKNVKPRQVISRDPQVKNLSGFDVYAFIEVVMPYYEDLHIQDYSGAVSEEKGGALYTFETNPGWMAVRAPELAHMADGSTGISHVYAWMRDGKLTPLGQGETTTALFDSIQVQNFADANIAGRVQPMTVNAYAVDAVITQDTEADAPDSPLAVWNLLCNTYPTAVPSVTPTAAPTPVPTAVPTAAPTAVPAAESTVTPAA